MKEQIEQFKQGKVVINVRTKEEYNKLMATFDEYNIRFYSDKASKINFWNDYKQKTCIEYCYERLLCSSIDYYQEEYYKIITFKDFMKGIN